MVALSPVSPSLAPALNYDRINAAIAEAAKVSNKQDAFDLAGLLTSVSQRVLQTDFAALQTAVNSKASAATVTALQNTVAAKANQSAVDTLTNSVASLSQALAGKIGQSAFDNLVSTVNGKAAQSALNDLRDLLFRINAGVYPSERPGDTPNAFTASRAGGDPGALAPLDTGLYPVRAVADGLGVEVSGSREVWERTLHAVEPGRLWRARWRYVRTTNAQDPENDSVQALIQWYDRSRATVGSPVQVEAFTPSVASGPHERLDFIGLSGVVGVTIPRPAGAVYFRLGLKAFGNEARTVLTDLHGADVSDIDDAIRRLVPEDALPALSGRIDDLVSALAQEVANREAGDEALNLRADAEELARQAADTTLGGLIDSEVARAVAAEALLLATLRRATGALFYEFSDLLAASLVEQRRAFATTLGATARSLAAEAKDTSRPPMRVLYDASGTTGLAVPDDPDVLHLIVFRGQSLALGATKGDPLSMVAQFPTRALMPEGGVHSYGGVSRLVPLVEGTFLGAIQETFAASTINHLIRYCDAVAPSKNSRFAAIVCAKGSTNLYGLKRGSDTYAQAISAVRDIARIEGAQGRRVRALEVWCGGENDQVTSGYAVEQLRDYDDFSTDVCDATGQRDPLVRIVVQTRAVVWDQRAFGPNVQCEQLAAADDSRGRIVVVPMYEGDCSPDDHIHMVSLGSYKVGPPIARAIRDHLFGRGHRPLRVTDGRFVPVPNGAPAGTVASILLDVPMLTGSLVKDTTGAVMTVGPGASTASGGIEVFDGAGGASLPVLGTSVAQAVGGALAVAPWQIRVDLAELPTGSAALVTIGGRRDDGGATTDDGPVTGCRTLFRRSTAFTRYGADGTANGPGSGLSYDWLCQGALTISAGPYVAAPTF